MAKYIRELLDLPTQVNKGEFVLNLAAGVSDSNATDTLRNYVVTPQSTACFEQAWRGSRRNSPADAAGDAAERMAESWNLMLTVRSRMHYSCKE